MQSIQLSHVRLYKCQMWCNSKAFASRPPTHSFQPNPVSMPDAEERIVRTSFSSQLLFPATIPLFLFNLCVTRSDGNLKLVCIQRLQKWNDAKTKSWFKMRPFGIQRKTIATKWLKITLNIKYMFFSRCSDPWSRTNCFLLWNWLCRKVSFVGYASHYGPKTISTLA